MTEIEVEVVFALAERQSLRSVIVAEGATAGEAIARSDLSRAFPEHDLSELVVGIWGREVPRTQLLRQGDRIEIYRPLELDPREARRQLAQVGRTMSKPESN